MRELQLRLNSREFAEWLAYYNLEPWGEERADLRAGIIAATVANAAPGRRGRTFQPKDFMPFTGERAQRQSTQEVEARIRLWVAAHNQAIAERAGKK